MLLLLVHSLLLLPLFVVVVCLVPVLLCSGPCFVMQCLVSFLVLQSPW